MVPLTPPDILVAHKYTQKMGQQMVTEVPVKRVQNCRTAELKSYGITPVDAIPEFQELHQCAVRKRRHLC